MLPPLTVVSPNKRDRDTGGEGARKMAKVDLERYASSRVKLNELFLHWLAFSSTQDTIASLLTDIQEGRPLAVSMPNSPRSPIAQPSSPRLGGQHSPPPRSPKSRPVPGPGGLPAGDAWSLPGDVQLRSPPMSPVSARQPHSRQHPKDKKREEPKKGPKRGHLARVIPRFYTPKNTAMNATDIETELGCMREVLAKGRGGVDKRGFASIVTDIWGFPSFFVSCLFQRIDSHSTGRVTEASIMPFWQRTHQSDKAARIFNIMRRSDQNYLTKEDFQPYCDELMSTHPGLQFLKDTPEFQERYGETVVCRMFYSCNRRGNGRMTLDEFVKGNLLESMKAVDEQPDINLVNDYFSYEHFYVIYCKFWELDTDHDFLLSRDDLLRYANHSLTYRIVDRIFQGVPRKLSTSDPDKMGYEDFIWFLLAEEDKGTDPALEYWFRSCDVDGDGLINAQDMLHFYQEQLHRMECLSQEIVSFEDVLTQLTDMVEPSNEGWVTLKDLKQCQMAPNFFNTLFNLNKFLAFEQRDPFLNKQEQGDELTEWDRFARAEYMRLTADEEEGEDLMQDLDDDLDINGGFGGSML